MEKENNSLFYKQKYLKYKYKYIIEKNNLNVGGTPHPRHQRDVEKIIKTYFIFYNIKQPETGYSNWGINQVLEYLNLDGIKAELNGNGYISELDSKKLTLIGKATPETKIPKEIKLTQKIENNAENITKIFNESLNDIKVKNGVIDQCTVIEEYEINPERFKTGKIKLRIRGQYNK